MYDYWLSKSTSNSALQLIIKENSDLKNKNKTIENNNKKLLKQNESFQTEKEEMEKKIKEINDFKDNYDNDLNALKDSNKKLMDDIEILKAENSKRGVDVAKLKNDNEELNAKILKLNIMNNEKDDDKDRAYDIIVAINSFFELNTKGWLVKYPKGKEEYEKKSKMDTIIVGVIGNRNKGKSFILQKLSGNNIPIGFFVFTEGLSIKYGEKEDHCIAILDSAGKEGPLLNPDKDFLKNIQDNINKNNSNEGEAFDNKREIYEKCLRDKLITETYIQKFIIENSHILILVVGDINLNEQKLLQNIKNTINDNQQLYVIHNLIDSHTKEQVSGYIEEKLKKLFGIELEERTFQDNNNNNNNNNSKEKYYQKYYIEKQKQKVIHFIFVNEYCNISEYYNTPTINFLKTKISSETNRTKFSVIDKCKEYFEAIGENFIEEKIKTENFDEVEDKIVLKNIDKITLKRVFIDEIGQTQVNNFGQPYYSYYTEGNDLIINIEVPGENADIKTRLQKVNEFYRFEFKGIKPYDEEIIKKEPNVKSVLKNKFEFEFSIYISFKDLTIGLNEKGNLNFYEKSKKDGIYTFKYHIINCESSGFE